MELRPSLDKSTLGYRQGSADTFDRIHRVHCRIVLIVRVKMGPVMRRAGLDKHANHDSKEP